MNIVFVHRRGAGQFRYLAAHLARRGARVTILTEEPDGPIAGVRFLNHGRVPTPPADRRFSHLAVADRYVQHGYRVAQALDRLHRADGAPDLVVGHIGWGGLLFVKDVLPRTPALAYCEYYFNSRGGDLGFDPSNPVTVAELGRARLRNMVQRATLDAVEAGFSPTAWQKSRYPGPLQHRIAVSHEGIDTDFCRPDDRARLTLPDGRTIAAGEPVVTYAARSLEPYRGFPQFMRAAAKIAARRKDVTFIVAGGDDVSYGRPPAGGGTWRATMLAETGIDPRRVVFLGTVDHASLVRLFQVSAAHVYLTVPFVLSWSVLEAMACGAPIVGSRTAPVEEVIADGRNGILTDFFDTDRLAARILAAVDRPEAMRPVRQAARATIERRYRRSDCLTRQVTVLGQVMSNSRAAVV